MSSPFSAERPMLASSTSRRLSGSCQLAWAAGPRTPPEEIGPSLLAFRQGFLGQPLWPTSTEAQERTALAFIGAGIAEVGAGLLESGRDAQEEEESRSPAERGREVVSTGWSSNSSQTPCITTTIGREPQRRRVILVAAEVPRHRRVPSAGPGADTPTSGAGGTRAGPERGRHARLVERCFVRARLGESHRADLSEGSFGYLGLGSLLQDPKGGAAQRSAGNSAAVARAW